RLGHHDVFRVERNESGWSNPRQLANVDSDNDDDLLPVLSDDELTIFFTSTRIYDVNGDIWVATRGSAADDFDPPADVFELNTPGLDFPGWLSPDGCRLYFTRAEGGGTQMYVASRPLIRGADAD